MASYIETENYGSYASIEALWSAHPEGGVEGAYCTINNVKYHWNKYDRMWIVNPNYGPTPARSVETFDGDVNFQNNVTIAGTLRAKHVKQLGVGLFATLTALQAAYPDPEVGMWAVVGNTMPGPIYRCSTAGTWTATGEDGGVDDLPEIVNNLTTGGSTKILSAEQGKVLKGLVDGIDTLLDSVTEDVESSAIDADMAQNSNIYISGPYTDTFCYLRTGGNGTTWGAGWEVSAGERYRVKFEKIVISEETPTFGNFIAIAFFANEPNTDLLGGSTVLKTPGDYSSYVKFGDFATAASSFDVEVPAGYTWMAVSSARGKTATVHKLGSSAVDLVVREEISHISPTHELQWSVPDTLYAIVGEEKRVYIDCILKDWGNYVVSFHGADYNTTEISGTDPQDNKNKCVACITGGYVFFRPLTTGETDVTLDVYDLHGTFISSKTLHFVAIAKSLPNTSKRVCIVGDSITEIYNMAWYTDNKFKALFPGSSSLPQFVGSKRGWFLRSPSTPSSAAATRPTRHEGWYGRTYQFLCTNSLSPFVNNGQLDIAHWRTADGTFTNDFDAEAEGCGLQSNEKVDVVSLALGTNGTPDAVGRTSELAYLKQLIAAFKADNANTIFVVHLNTLLGRGEGADPCVNKELSHYMWRQLLLSDTDFANDSNIIIGDLGCCYDRFWAYRVETVHPLGDWDSYSVTRIKFDKGANSYGYSHNDTLHPSDDGERQLGESIVPVLLRAMQGNSL